MNKPGLPILLAALALAGPAAAQVMVSEAWSRPAAAGGTGAGYMTLMNHGTQPDALVRVETPAARTVQIHRSSIRNGVASMQKEDRVTVPAGGSLTFAPGGRHLMLLGLKQALKTGDSVPATLVFASGAKLATQFTVRVAPPAPEAAHHHGS